MQQSARHVVSSIKIVWQALVEKRQRIEQARLNIRKLARSFHVFNNSPTMWQTDGNGDLIRVVKYKPTTTRYSSSQIL